jgi:predicted ferric reductase
MELSTILFAIGKFAGITGFFCLSFIIFSGDTARFWDRWFGLDRIIKFQRKFSLFTALFVVMHPLFFIIASGNIGGFLIPNSTFPALTAGIIAFYIFVLVMIASHLYKRVSYKIWQYIHVLTYILFAMALYHAFNWGSNTNILWPLYLITVIAIVIGAIYRTQYKLRALKRGSFVVKSIKNETHDTFTLHITSEKESQNLGAPISFKAGQFCFLRLDGMKLHARHPFTIASAPNENELRFTIKDSGRFTAQARQLSPGTKINIDGPFGRFKAIPNKKLVFIAGGVGITPFMSMILDNINKEEKGQAQNITLIYGSKTESDIIFKDKFDSINSNWFKKIYVLSNADSIPLGNFEKGFVNTDLLKKYVNDDSETIYYICGPEIMKNNVKKALSDLNVPNKRIKVEDFFW